MIDVDDSHSASRRKLSQEMLEILIGKFANECTTKLVDYHQRDHNCWKGDLWWTYVLVWAPLNNLQWWIENFKILVNTEYNLRLLNSDGHILVRNEVETPEDSFGFVGRKGNHLRRIELQQQLYRLGDRLERNSIGREKSSCRSSANSLQGEDWGGLSLTAFLHGRKLKPYRLLLRVNGEIMRLIFLKILFQYTWLRNEHQ